MPPNSTVLPRPWWKHIAGRSSGPGLPVVVICAQSVPFHSQVPLSAIGKKLFELPP
jgi:hypothetical protein